MAKRSIRSTKEIEAENIPVFTEEGTFSDAGDVDLNPSVNSDHIDGGESPDNYGSIGSPAGAEPWNGLDITDTKYAKEEEVIDSDGADTVVVVHVNNGVYRTKSGKAIRSSCPLQIKSSKTSVLVPISSDKLVKARVMGSLSKKMSLFVRSGRHAYNGRGQCIMNVKENFILADSAGTFVRSSSSKETIKSLLSRYIKLSRANAHRTSVQSGVRRSTMFSRPVVIRSSRMSSGRRPLSQAHRPMSQSGRPVIIRSSRMSRSGRHIVNSSSRMSRTSLPVVIRSSRMSRVRRVRPVSSGAVVRRPTRFGTRYVSSSRMSRESLPVVIRSSRMSQAHRPRPSGTVVRRPSVFSASRGAVRRPSAMNRPIVINSSKMSRRNNLVRSNRRPVKLSVGSFERPRNYSPSRQAVASAKTQQVRNQENFQSYVESKKVVAPKQVNSKRQQQFEQNVSLLTSRMR